MNARRLVVSLACLALAVTDSPAQILFDAPVPFDGGMRLGPQACSSLLQVEKLGRIAESILRVGAKPFGNGHTPDRSDVS